MAEQAGEQIQRLRSRRGQPVDPVPDLDQLKQCSVPRPLRVRVVQLKNQVLDCLWVKVHAVAKQRHAVDFHVTQVLGGIGDFQRLQVQRAVPLGRVSPDFAP